ncbi:uncharacterized protein LOC118441379 isoform X2 [Vespa mandarinia]|uniref:uncharacterized protein LOC118441379 isoform X2 n=1 Tax=Vespa mandarinia TaxID=7446 RepID=UPI00161B185D|nr:uncharacterized protein LOC118441379 isoform X2 [Vespa mandarinia]
MGIKQSRYESSSIQNYYKLSYEEYWLIKQLWKDIENKPQYYGNLFFTSFLRTHPQYIKYYTLNPHVPLGVDIRLCAKFTLIMEAIGYLILDVYKNRKQLDRLVGYVAMIHKDMRLNKEDMRVCHYEFRDKFFAILGTNISNVYDWKMSKSNENVFQ